MIVTSGNFSEWLKSQKKDRKMTSSDIAKASGLTSASINGFLRGAQLPRFETLEALAKAFDMRIEIRKN